MSKKLTQRAKHLRAAGRILRDPKKRTVGAFARNAEGYTADALSEDAVSFCLIGALRKVVGGKYAPDYNAVCSAVESRLGIVKTACTGMAHSWDNTDTRGRTRIAKKLATYVEYE